MTLQDYQNELVRIQNLRKAYTSVVLDYIEREQLVADQIKSMTIHQNNSNTQYNI